MNYSYCYINNPNLGNLSFDVFLSSFDGCERTQKVYDAISANTKVWLVFPQYGIDQRILPIGCFKCGEYAEDDYIFEFAKFIKLDSFISKKICIDSSGFLIPHLLFLIALLRRMGVRNLFVLYSEPIKYKNGEDTSFAYNINETRPIAGYSAVQHEINSDEMLFILAGYNDMMIRNAALAKQRASVKYLFSGFPSLQADMYQQSLLQLHKVKETIGSTNVFYQKAPACDPFVTAQKIQNLINFQTKVNNSWSSIDIVPLSTKPQAIAAALVSFYNPDLPINVLFPSAEKYESGFAIGVKRTWLYMLEL